MKLRLLWKAGDYDTAIAGLEKALNIGKQDKNTMFQLAQAYDKKGDKENANQWYQKIIDEFPGTKALPCKGLSGGKRRF